MAAAPEVGADRRRDRRRPARCARQAGGWVPRRRGRRSSRAASVARIPSRRVRRARGRSPDPDGDRVVLVHDGARPVVSADARPRRGRRDGAARRGDPGRAGRRDAQAASTGTASRRPSTARRSPPAQTPQGVRRGILRDALRRPVAADGTWTDEAALLEACRIAVHVVPGDPANLKVTVPADLERAAVAARRVGPARRPGSGTTAHPFGPGGPLRLGGVEIAGAPRPARPLRWRRRPPRRRRRPARRGRPGRPRPDVPGRSGDAARHRQRRRCSPRSSHRLADGGLATGGRRPDDRRRPAAAGAQLDAMRGAIAALLGLPVGRRQRQGVDAATSTAPRAPDGRSRALALATIEARPMSDVRLHDTLSGETRPLVPLRDDGVRIYSCGPTVYGPGPHRELPVVPVRRSARPPPALARPPGHVGDEHHRHRRQDHPRRGGCGRVDRRPGRLATSTRFLADAESLRMTRPDVLPRATEHIERSSPSSRRCSSAATPIAPTTARSSSGSPRGRPTAASPGSIPSRCASASASRPTSTPRTTFATSRSGRGPSRASRRGRRGSARAGRAGTSSARR